MGDHETNAAVAALTVAVVDAVHGDGVVDEEWAFLVDEAKRRLEEVRAGESCCLERLVGIIEPIYSHVCRETYSVWTTWAEPCAMRSLTRNGRRLHMQRHSVSVHCANAFRPFVNMQKKYRAVSMARGMERGMDVLLL